MLIDTNIAIRLTDGQADVSNRIAALDTLPVISLVTLIELEGGVRKNRSVEAVRRLRLAALLRWIEVLPFDRDVVAAYGDIIATVGFSRTRLLDRLIAATAILHDLTLITANGPDFRDVPDLKLEIWPPLAQ